MPEGGERMARQCPHCESEMLEEYDHVNRVRVLVCSRPTCLFRMYPDYPRRKGNEEVCYSCQQIFKVPKDDAGILCPQCKAKVLQNKNAPVNGNQRGLREGLQGAGRGDSHHKARISRAV